LDKIEFLSYQIAFAGRYFFDLAAFMTGRQFPISSIRIKKFCAGTQIAADKLHEAGFIPRYSLEQAFGKMIAADFHPNSQP
jgi:GlcNAc-P-P-Und epimerase